MLTRLSRCGVLALALLSAGAQAAERTQSGLIVSKVSPEGTGVLVTFTVRPTDCTTAYKGGHAYLGTSLKDFDTLYLTLTTAQVTAAPVTISYNDNGDCSGVATLLSLSNVIAN